MLNLTIVPEDNSALLGAGEHSVTIKQVYADQAKPSEHYEDLTDQLAIVFEDADGKVITRWYNLKGFELNATTPTRKDSEGRDVPNYAVDKKGFRIENVANTQKAMKIIAQLAIHAGFEAGKGIKPDALEGAKLNIMVTRDSAYSSNKVAYTMPVAEVAETADAEFAE